MEHLTTIFAFIPLLLALAGCFDLRRALRRTGDVRELLSDLPAQAEGTSAPTKVFLSGLSSLSPAWERLSLRIRHGLESGESTSPVLLQALGPGLYREECRLPPLLRQPGLVLGLGAAAVSLPWFLGSFSVDRSLAYFAVSVFGGCLLHAFRQWLLSEEVHVTQAFSRQLEAMESSKAAGGEQDAAFERLSSLLLEQNRRQIEQNEVMLSELSRSLQGSFSGILRAELSPSLNKMAELSELTTKSTQKFIDSATRSQVQGVQQIIQLVMQGIDKAVGDSLRETTEAFSASVDRQESSMDRWRRSVESVAQLVETLQGTAIALSEGADKMAHAAQPVEAASEVFSIAAQRLQATIPAIEGTAEVYEKSLGSLQQAHISLQRGTDAYLQAGRNLREMVNELRESHSLAVQRISQGVDEAVLGSMREAGNQLLSINAAQADSLKSWKASTEAVKETVDQLQETAGLVAHFATEIRDAGEPTLKASQAFLVASERLETTAPKLVEAASAHDSSRQAMEAAAKAMSDGIEGYNRSSELFNSMVDKLNETHELAVARVSEGVDEALGQSLRDAGTQLATSLGSASSSLGLTLDSANEKMERTFLIAQQGMESSLRGAGRELGESLHTSRQQLVEALSDMTQQLDGTVRGAGITLTKEWADTGSNIRDSIRLASKELGQSVQEAGRILSIRVDDASQSMEDAARAASAALRLGAEDARTHFGNVGGSWEESVVAASDALRQAGDSIHGSFKDAGDALKEAARESGGQLERGSQEARVNLSSIGSTWEESIRAGAKAIESGGEEARNALLAASKNFRIESESAGLSFAEQIREAGGSLDSSAESTRSALLAISENLENSSLRAGKHLEERVGRAGGLLDTSAERASELLSGAFAGADTQMRESLLRVGKQMEDSLNMAHRKLAETLEGSSSDLRALSDAQAVHLRNWTEIVQTLQPALSDLRTSATDLGALVVELKAAMTPAVTASGNFRVAAERISTVFPNIESTATSYRAFNKSLQEASSQFSSTTSSYLEACGSMDGLLQDIRQSLVLQTKCNQVFSKTLTQVTDSVRNLEPVSMGMQSAAQDVRAISEQTASAVAVIRQATVAQDASVRHMQDIGGNLLTVFQSQSQQLGQFSKEMVKLQNVLGTGVDAFADRLPHSVEQTLVHFDAALGEGVARLGTSIERLREAMDDLLERMDSMFETKRRR
jgi:hypothetical protein